MGAVLPQALLHSLHRAAGFDEQAFVDVHASDEQVVSIRINPAKAPKPVDGSATASDPLSDPREPFLFTKCGEPVPWCRFGYYLPDRPSFITDPCWHAGAYYVQEASSMFVEQCMVQCTDLSQPLRVLDLCAAPGGKSTLLQSLLSPESILVSNEPVPARANILVENMTRWGAANTIVTSNQPADFGRLPGFFDVVLVDAPCSGSGLFRRDPDAVNEWSPGAVTMCSRRQQKILADVYPALKQGGMLIYATCSYSVEEDEDICDWLCQHYDLTPVQLQTAGWGTVASGGAGVKTPGGHTVAEDHGRIMESGGRSGAYGYRFFPYNLKGEGFFLACFRKNDGAARPLKTTKRSKLVPLTRAEKEQIASWIRNPSMLSRYHLGKEVFLWPQSVDEAILQVNANLYTKKAGILAGRLMGRELVPAHELALSGWVNAELLTISLKKEEALRYLRREEVNLAVGNRGWALVQHAGLNLGWVKILPNRVNNYYPREWRILKSDFD